MDFKRWKMKQNKQNQQNKPVNAFGNSKAGKILHATDGTSFVHSGILSEYRNILCDLFRKGF